jgi:hypothetical protein
VAVPNVIKQPVPFDFVFPYGVLLLGIEPAIDFDRRGRGDDQARDKETGERMWIAHVLDLDPVAGRFGRSKEHKVKMLAPVQPVPPPPAVEGYPPEFELTGVTITPYVDTQRCRPPEQGKTHQCRARLAWSIRATGLTAPKTAGKPKAA